MSVPVSFELESLASAVNYQQWLIETITPNLGDSILEVGAGIGNMSQLLPVRSKLIITEAELGYIPLIKNRLADKTVPNLIVEHVDLSKDWLSDFTKYNLDTIVSFNVLEHIEDDVTAFRSFVELLKKSETRGPKKIITLVPAHQFLFGSLDEVFGHFRRYDSASTIDKIKAIDPKLNIKTQYFNIFGIVGWFVLGKILKKKSIGLNSIRSFELICPYIKSIDNFLHEKLKLPLGQSLLIIIEIP